MADREFEGGLVTGPAGEDSIPVLLRPGERVYDADGHLIFAVGGEVPPGGPGD